MRRLVRGIEILLYLLGQFLMPIQDDVFEDAVHVLILDLNSPMRILFDLTGYTSLQPIQGGLAGRAQPRRR